MAAKGRKSDGSRKTIKFKQAVIAGSVLVLGLTAVNYRSKKVASKTVATEAPPIANASSYYEPPKESKPYDSKAHKAQVARKRAQYAARALLGLKSLELKEVDGLLRIPFRFTPHKVWCQGGDLDTMKYASKDLSANEILISLEPNGSGKGDFLRTSVAALYNGVEHTFKLQPGSSPQIYGLYICSDSKQGKSCKNKSLKSHAEISNDVSNANGSSKNNYIFYFQPVVFDKNSLEVYKSDDASDAFKDSIEAYLEKQKGIDSSELKAAWKVSKVIRSSSPEVQGGRLQLSLPYNDPRCMGRGRK